MNDKTFECLLMTHCKICGKWFSTVDGKDQHSKDKHNVITLSAHQAIKEKLWGKDREIYQLEFQMQAKDREIIDLKAKIDAFEKMEIERRLKLLFGDAVANIIIEMIQ
eukprot:95361_1